jgi:hypothetical protein
MNERDLLVDCLRRLNRLDIPYMLTGSMASNFWGVPRTTHDLDFVVHFPRESAAAVAGAFEDGYFIDESAVREPTTSPPMFNAIDRRSALKVDFWFLRSEAFEQNMFKRRRKESLFGETAWITTAEDVILHKLYWNRITPSDRQLGDAAGVVAVQAEALDRSYLEKWAVELGVRDALEDLLSGRIGPKTT